MEEWSKVKKDAKGSFVVHIQHRENASWQGQLLWADKGKVQHFRSALELIKLIDGALDQTDS